MCGTINRAFSASSDEFEDCTGHQSGRIQNKDRRKLSGNLAGLATERENNSNQKWKRCKEIDEISVATEDVREPDQQHLLV